MENLTNTKQPLTGCVNTNPKGTVKKLVCEGKYLLMLTFSADPASATACARCPTATPRAASSSTSKSGWWLWAAAVTACTRTLSGSRTAVSARSRQQRRRPARTQRRPRAPRPPRPVARRGTQTRTPPRRTRLPPSPSWCRWSPRSPRATSWSARGRRSTPSCWCCCRSRRGNSPARSRPTVPAGTGPTSE